MAEQTITRVCASYDEAVQYVYDLERAGLPEGAVSVIGSDIDHRLPDRVLAEEGKSPVAVGATLGAVLGGGLGLLAGIGALPVPGLGPLVAAGWLVACLVGAGIGAVIGGLIGLLVRLLMGRQGAHSIAAAVENGQYVVLVRVDQVNAAAVQNILTRPLPDDVREAVRNPVTPEPGDPTTSSSGVVGAVSPRVVRT